MKTIVISFAALGACLPLPPEHTYDDERTVTIDWALKGADDVAGQCPSGFDSIVVKACTTEDLYSCFTATTSCEATGSQSLTVYTSGRYRPDDESSFWDLSTQYWMQTCITDSSADEYTDPHSCSVAIKKDLTSGDAEVETDLYPDAGFVRLAWNFESAASGNYSYRCDELEIDEVELAYGRNIGTNPAKNKTVRWPCMTRASMDPDASDAGEGDSKALAAGTYVADAVAYRGGVEVGRYTDLTFEIRDRGELTETSAYIEITDR